MKDWTGTGTSTFKTIGASNHTAKEREAHDYYATEPKAAELLCDLFQFLPIFGSVPVGKGIWQRFLMTVGIWSGLPTLLTGVTEQEA